MKKLLIFMGYLAGFVVGAKYAKKPDKKWGKWNKKMADSTLETGKDFIESHKKAFTELKKEYWTAENKKLILSKKKDLEKFFELAKAELTEAQEVLKKHGVDTDAIGEKIESIYTEKKSFIEKLGKTPTAKTAKKKLSALVTKIKKSI
jgi:isocitrate/isopropylmalate dehydrogenase